MKKFLSITSAMATMAAGVAGLSAPTYAISPPNITSCEALQEAINADDADAYPTVLLQQNITCNTDITIPSGKEVYLDLGSSFYVDSNGGVNFDDGASINVEEGAILHLVGSAITTTDEAVVKNYGKLYVHSRQSNNEPTTEISSYGTAIANYGELNVVPDSIGAIITGSISNNDGVVRLAGGRYSDSDFAKEYIVDGCELQENVGGSIYSDITCEEPHAVYGHSLPGMFLETMPLGYFYSITFNHPDLAYARGYHLSSSDQNIISTSGNAYNGFIVSADAPGEATLYYGSFSNGGIAIVRAYDVTLNGKSILPNDSLANQLIGQDVYAMFNDENYELNAQMRAGAADPQFAYDDEDIAKALNGDKAIGFYDIAYIIFDDDDNILANVTDLNEPIEFSLGIPVDLPKLAEGYIRKFYVIRKHYDTTTGRYQIDILPATVVGNQAKFKSDKFSTFVLAYTDVEKEADPTDDSETNQSSEDKSDASTPSTSTKEQTDSADESKVSAPDTGDSADESKVSAPDTGAATGSQALSSVAVFGSIISGIITAFALFPKIRKFVSKK